MGKKSDGVEFVDVDTNGQGLIPGTEVATIKEIQSFVKRHEGSKEAHAELTRQLETENDEAVSLYKKYKQYFNEDRKGNMVYSDESGAYMEVPKPKGIKIKTKIIAKDSGPVAESKSKPAGKPKAAPKAKAMAASV